MEKQARSIDKAEGFDWDRGNREKSWKKHGILPGTCEEVFFNQPLLVLEDEFHSKSEKRFKALGVDNKGQRLFISFVLRLKKIRVISARPMSRRERRHYETAKKENS